MRFRTLILGISAAAVTLPCVVMGWLQYRAAQNELNDFESHRKQTSMFVSDRLDARLESALSLVMIAGNYLRDERFGDTLRLSQFLEHVKSLDPDFLNVHYDNAEGVSVAFVPPKNALGESNVGVDHGERAHWKNIGTREGPVIGDVIQGVGATDNAIVNITKPVYENGKLIGLAVAALDLQEISRQVLKGLPHDRFRIAIFDSAGKEIFSSRNDEPLPRLTQSEREMIRTGSLSFVTAGFYGYFTPLSIADWSVGVFSREIDRNAVYKDLLSRNIVVWLLTVAAALLIGQFASRSVVRSVEKLARQMSAARSLPQRAELIRSPKELVKLQATYGRMQERLLDTQMRLKELNRSLEEKVRDQVKTIRKQETMLGAVFAGMNEGFLLGTASGRLILTNDAAKRMTGQNEKELSEAFRDHWIWESREGKNSILRKIGEHDYEIRFFEIREEELVCVLMKDVTAEVELDRLKDELIGVAAHELKTPLAAIRLEAEYLKSTTRDPIVKDSAVALLEDADEMKALISRWLDVAKLQAGAYVLHRELCLIKPIINRALKHFKGEADFEAELIVDEEAKVGYIDRSAFMQIVLNLLSNARKYKQSDAICRVRIHATKNGNDLTLSIRDNGIGMNPEECRKVFDRFYQGQMSSTRKAGGTGLGLFITKKLVELHGGEIRVKSEAGLGTEFIFTVSFPNTESFGGTGKEKSNADTTEHSDRG